MLFFLLKGLPGMSKREVAGEGGGGREGGCNIREWFGRCKIEWPARLPVSLFLYDKISRSLPLRYCYCYFIVQRPTLHEYAVTQW